MNESAISQHGAGRVRSHLKIDPLALSKQLGNWSAEENEWVRDMKVAS
jgi:hypothetical protein